MPWSTVVDNVLLPFRIAGRAGSAERERVAAEIARGRARRVRARLSAPAFGRHAHASFDRPRLGHRSRSAAARRTLRGARRDHPDGAQRRSVAALGKPPHDRRVRHAQRLRIGLPVDPDRGDDGPARAHRRRSARGTAAAARARAAHIARAMPRSARRCRRSWRARWPRRRIEPSPGFPVVADRCAARGRRRPLACGKSSSGSTAFRPTSCPARSRSPRACGPTARACSARCW